MTLDQIQPGIRCRIKKIAYVNSLGVRLLSLGVYPGKMLTAIRYAPLGDPMEIPIDGGAFLSLRRREAGLIEVDTVS